ncbi:hypothetical protein QOZ80_1BG0098140 [Eleusine coracana subsp. coracana]|nr:hypothetical protein QOZ80_1BG0098140 [Eleusine coracana subsp. coracana]
MKKPVAEFLLSSLAAGDRLRRLLPAAHARAVVSDGLRDLFLANLLLRGYSKLGLVHHARRLFDGMPHRNLVSWSSAISMYAQRGADDQAVSIFASFRKASDEPPNEFLLAGVLRACTQSRAFYFGDQVHGVALKLALTFNVYVGSALINLYAKSGSMDAAMRLFDALPVKNPVTWTAVISGYSQTGQGQLALELFQKMGLEGAQPDRQIHAHVIKSNLETDEYVKNALIDMYAKCNTLTEARAKLRRGMDYAGTVKEPGYSWIEVMKEVHTFIARGREHPQAELIYSVLDELTSLLKDPGYLTDISEPALLAANSNRLTGPY